MPENSDYDKPLPSKRLREALMEASAVLGRSTQDALLHDLELNGIALDEGYYTLRQVQDAIRKVFGHDGTSLLMQRIERILETAN